MTAEERDRRMTSVLNDLANTKEKGAALVELHEMASAELARLKALVVDDAATAGDATTTSTTGQQASGAKAETSDGLSSDQRAATGMRLVLAAVDDIVTCRGYPTGVADALRKVASRFASREHIASVGSASEALALVDEWTATEYIWDST